MLKENARMSRPGENQVDGLPPASSQPEKQREDQWPIEHFLFSNVDAQRVIRAQLELDAKMTRRAYTCSYAMLKE